MKSITIRLPLRRLLALFLVILLAAGGIPTCVHAAEPNVQFIGEAAAIRGTQQLPSAAGSGVFSLPVEVRFCQTEARSELNMINELRTGGNAWYWNSSNTEKIYVSGLSELQYDYDLEKVAMQRAAEIAVYYDHSRPDGNMCWQTYDDYGYSWYTLGENIAAGYTSAEDVFVGWAEEDEDYSGQGHRRNMLSSKFTAVGCACVYYEGCYYWVQNFAAPVQNTTKTAASDGNETRNVLVKNEYADQWALTKTELNINANEPTDILDLLRVKYQLSIVGWDSAQGWLRSSMLKLDWQPKDPAIVTYKDGILTGKTGGTTTMTALSPDGGTTLTVTVHVTGTASEHQWQNVQYEWSEDLCKVTASATCSHCSEILQETVSTAGTVTRQATCTANGETTYTAVFTNPAFSEQKRTAGDIPALGHDIVVDAAVAATCTEPGLSEGEHCTRCDYKVEQEVVPATDHSWNDGEITKPATETEDGVKTYTCTVCGATKTEIIPATGETPCEHEHAYPDHRDATCTEDGYDRTICDDCGAILSETILPALGHDLITDPAKAATCTEAGLTEGAHCSRCDYKVAQETVAALGHDWDEGKVTKPATETTDGVKTFTCSRCGATKTEKIPATGGKTNPFIDVKEGAFYYDAVLWAVNADPQVTAGTSATTFSPDATCTRAQVVTFLWRAKGCPEPKSDNNPFTDVKAGEYYYKAVLWAVENNITAGTSATTFSPNAGCTRAQVVTFLWRTEGQPKPSSSANPFRDVTGGYYYDAVLWAVEKNITAGTSATTFSPDNTCTRGQIVTFLYRAFAG
ncbi:MAG: S-layer homology domain-containing protein [Oscillospiraceae bacterium]|nr:S-layer homology domain-containing protein [Oscillospiraceae bacterium]